jgi:hypothetical protein
MSMAFGALPSATLPHEIAARLSSSSIRRDDTLPASNRSSATGRSVPHMWRLFGALGAPHSFLASHAKITGSVHDQHAIVSHNNRLNRTRTAHFSLREEPDGV